jgi:hypothetical protein
MAAGAACSVRLISDSVYITKYLRDHNLDIVGKAFIWDIRMNLALTNGLGTSMSIANAIMNGTVTPAKVFVDSSSASDDTGGTDHCQEVTVIGIVADGTPTLDRMPTNGLTGLDTGEALWRRLVHAYGSAWGSGDDDAAGNITIQDDAAGTNDYLTIAAGANESDGLKIYLGGGWRAMVEMEMNITAMEDTTKAGNISMKALYNGFEEHGTDPDYAYDILSMGRNGAAVNKRLFPGVWYVEEGGEGTIDFENTYLGATGSAMCSARVIVWKRG